MKVRLALIAIPLVAQQISTVEKERVLGEHLASEVRRDSQPVEHPAVQAYANRVAERLVNQLADRLFDYTFEVVRFHRGREPVALPGGFVLIPASFFLSAQDEAEFAAVLAHCIAHIHLRHGVRSENFASIPVVILGGGPMGYHVASARPRSLAPRSFLERLRNQELEADRFGLELTIRAGYDGSALRRYLERTQGEDTGQSPLPARETRLAQIEEVAASFPRASAVSETGEFRAMQDVIRSGQARKAPSLLR